ncbi:unnamed protein product [Arabidopsis halleri]
MIEFLFPLLFFFYDEINFIIVYGNHVTRILILRI